MGSILELDANDAQPISLFEGHCRESYAFLGAR